MGFWKGAKYSNKVAKLATLHAFPLTSLSAWLQQHTCTGISGPQPIRGGIHPSLSLIGLDHDMGLMCVCCWTTGRLSESRRLFFFLERLVTPVRPQFFVNLTIEKLGRTLEPWINKIQILYTSQWCSQDRNICLLKVLSFRVKNGDLKWKIAEVWPH